MKLKINTWQRMQLVLALGSVSGPVATYRQATKLLDLLELQPDEQGKVGFVMMADGAARWADEAHRWEIEIKDGNLAAFLRRVAQSHAQWPVAQRGLVDDLLEQLGVEEDDG